MFIARDLDQFKTLFVDQLKNMLTDDELGAFILVLANSQQDTFLKDELADDLKRTSKKLKEMFSLGKLKATQDDSGVFEKLLGLDQDNIPVWNARAKGEWQLVCNTLRQLRPARASSHILKTIKQPYDRSGFHFNKPFLKPEILWEGEFEGVTSRVLFNKFPFSDYHLLIVVSPEENSPQLLTEEKHRYAFSLVAGLADIFPGFGIGFNSLAAGASVNHFHFQGFIREPLFPIEKKHWHHNAGNVDYPLEVKCFQDAGMAWHHIHQLIEDDVAFNCLYRKNTCYVVPRKYQGSVDLPDWLTGPGWLDVAGVITVSDEARLNSIGESSITQALASLSVHR